METITMTPEEQAEFELFRAEKENKQRAEKTKQDRETYKELVDETINSVFSRLEKASENLSVIKKDVYDAFQKALTLKSDIFQGRAENKSNTFTNKDSTRRITLGQYETDGYDDTVNEGVMKAKRYISSLAKDDDSNMLVREFMKLLSKDQKGNLKPSKVMRLREMAEESQDEEFLDGVRIIGEAYRPQVSKFYIKAEKKDAIGAWVSVPLGITEA